jgi:hypothetical protein
MPSWNIFVILIDHNKKKIKFSPISFNQRECVSTPVIKDISGANFFSTGYTIFIGRDISLDIASVRLIDDESLIDATNIDSCLYEEPGS